MGLSERDQQVLAQLELSLGTSDPDWAARMSRGRAHSRRRYLAGLLIFVGFGALVGGAMLALKLQYLGILISISGFVLLAIVVWDLFYGPHRLTALKRFRTGYSYSDRGKDSSGL